MTQRPTKLLNKNFIIFVLAKEVSFIGRTLLRFALPLYILLETGSPTLMATILAISAIPSILFAPIGGVIADRFQKKKLLSLANFGIAIAILIYLVTLETIGIIPATILIMLLLLTFDGLITLTTKASVPVIIPEGTLVKANSVTVLSMTCASIITPILGGFILARFGLRPVLFTSITCLFLATLMNTLTQIPCTTRKIKGNFLKTVIKDFQIGIHFITKEKPKVGKVIVLVNMLYCITLYPLTTIALPILVTGYFGRGEEALGITQAIIVFGGTLGVTLITLLGKKATINKVRPLLFLSSFNLIPLMLTFFFNNHEALTYLLLVTTLFINFALSSMMAIICRTYFGENAPEEMVGKVMALNSSLVILGVSIGGYLYGILFNQFAYSPGVVLAILASASAIVAFFAKVEK